MNVSGGLRGVAAIGHGHRAKRVSETGAAPGIGEDEERKRPRRRQTQVDAHPNKPHERDASAPVDRVQPTLHSKPPWTAPSRPRQPAAPVQPPAPRAGALTRCAAATRSQGRDGGGKSGAARAPCRRAPAARPRALSAGPQGAPRFQGGGRRAPSRRRQHGRGAGRRGRRRGQWRGWQWLQGRRGARPQPCGGHVCRQLCGRGGLARGRGACELRLR
jgi:hypothetical protein